MKNSVVTLQTGAQADAPRNTATSGHVYTPEDLAHERNFTREHANGETEWHGAHPGGDGATDDGFILNSDGTAFDRKLSRRFTSPEVAGLFGISPDQYAPCIEHSQRNSHSKKSKTAPPPRGLDWNRVDALHNYTDEKGTLLFQVGRKGNGKNKLISQRRPDPNGGWIFNLQNTRRVLYRLADVVKAQTVIICEGEKAADALNDDLKGAELFGQYVATTTPQGAGNSHKTDLAPLFGKAVVILPDDNKQGQEYRDAILRAIGSHARVRVVNLPDRGNGGDYVDFRRAGHSFETARQLIEAAPEWEASAGNTDATAIGANGKQPASSLFNFTDLGNAERFATQHGEELRYCYPWGKWLAWDGRRWKADNTGEVKRRAKRTVRSIYGEAAGIEDDAKRRDVVTHARKSEAGARIAEMIQLAASDLPILPEDLDRDPFLLNCINGTLNLKTGELHPHQRENLLTKLTPVEYDSAATCPQWNDFLHEIMGGNLELIGFLQRAIGYVLTGDTREQVLFMLHGAGANGKSTLLDIVLALVGDYGLQTDTETLMSRKKGGPTNDIARLRGARFVSTVETEEGRRLAEVLVKQLTGGDTVTARFLHQEFFEFKPECKLFLATNHKPTIRGTDNAIWRRIRLVPFEVTIPSAKQDRRLSAKLRAELPGILAWAVRGCLEWQVNGLGTPAEVTRATESYRAEMDVIQAFIDDCCIEAQNAKAIAKDLYNAYKAWCEANGEHPTRKSDFSAKCKERGYFSDRGTGNRPQWHGVGLRQNEQETPKKLLFGAE